MESIGDFALNIIPNLNTLKLYSGITALDSLTNIADKIFRVFKGAYGVIDDTADKLRDLSYVGQQLNMPIEQVKTLEYTMRKFGLNSKQAAEALKSIQKFRGGAPFGEFDTNLILKAGLLPTDFGKDTLKNLDLLASKYNATDNINVRAAIAALVPGLERLLTNPALLRRYYLESQRQADLALQGLDKEQIEKYGKSKGDLSIALDGLAIAMTNAALPGLTDAITGLTQVMNEPEIRSFFTGTGKILNLAGRTAGENIAEPPMQLIPNILKQHVFGMKKEDSLLIEFFKRNFNVKGNALSAKESAQQYLNAKFNVHVTTDGTAADVKIEEERNKRNMNSIENTHRTQRVSN
jgi:hypothetical protein